MKRPAAATTAANSSAGQYEEDTCLLGEGSYGTVVKARHRATGRTVAIKRLVPADEDDDGHLEEELQREARFLEACDGVPFVVGYHELVRDPETQELLLVMECAGPSMNDFLCRKKRKLPRGASPLLPEPALRGVMWQLLTAAEGMHGRGVVHRDIKPDNILVAGDLRSVKLRDFGQAMSMSESSDPPPCEPAGTPGYRAPEMLLELPEYDGRVDSWSLGCVMAEIIAGKPLFDAIDCPTDDELLAILSVLGVPDEEAWPGFFSTPFAVECGLSELDLQQPNVLREVIPEAKLSDQGFQVLSGLLVCNPDKRLTAAAALKLPWFAEMDDLKMPRQDEALVEVADSPKKKQKLLWA